MTKPYNAGRHLTGRYLKDALQQVKEEVKSIKIGKDNRKYAIMLRWYSDGENNKNLISSDDIDRLVKLVETIINSLKIYPSLLNTLEI